MAIFMGKNLKPHKKTIRFTDEEIALLEEVMGERTITDTIMAGLRALREDRRNKISQADIIGWIRRNTKESDDGA